MRISLSRATAGGKWHLRPDGMPKVTGSLTYLTDMKQEGMLYGLILRSPHPHAWILSIRTEAAERLPGVHAVITHRDVPGLNLFGIAMPDQPVLCEDRVRYIGDAVAAVAAESEAIAQEAIRLIEVVYEPLPVLASPEQALADHAPKLHPAGNVLHRTNYKKGSVDDAFAQCAVVIEDTYYTPRQMHGYMETEGGLFVPEEGGKLTVYAPTQHGFKDRMQLSRILAIPESDIRVVSSPIGGSFGGKDELNVQPFGALLALKSGKTVKLHYTRWESVRAGLKRHPMAITMRTGADQNGKLIAHQVRIVADTGAYATLGAPVLNFATEHAMGPYRIPHIDIEGTSVYTNNGVSGEFRGFGGNQSVFAMESQMNRLAAALHMDPWDIRQVNLRHRDDLGPLGQRIVETDGAGQVWRAIQSSPIWQRKEQAPAIRNLQESKLSMKPFKFAIPDPSAPLQSEVSAPWIRRGIGAAMTMHGSGLGFGIPDPAGGCISLNAEGKIEAAFGYEEFGQGLLATLEILVMQHFGCTTQDLHLVIGDTAKVPHSGSTTASRATSMMWQSLQKIGPALRLKLLEAASKLTAISIEQLVTGPGGIWLKEELDSVKEDSSSTTATSIFRPVITYLDIAASGIQDLVCNIEFHYPTTPDAIFGGHFLYTYAGVAVEVEVNLLTGRVKVIDQYHAVAAGPVVNPMGYLGQLEGGSSMALGFTLSEDAVMENGHYLTRNLDTYLMPTLLDTPRGFELEAIEDLPEGDIYGPRGVGEVGTVAIAPAVTAAIHAAIGRFATKLPVSPQWIIDDITFMQGGDEYD